MKRTKIQLEEKVWEALRTKAFEERSSVAEIIRRMVRQYTQKSGIEKCTDPSFSFVGSGRSRGKGSGKIAERHDEEIAGAI